MGTKTFDLYLLAVIAFASIGPIVPNQPDENVAPIRVPNFLPRGHCSFKDEMFKKYIDKLGEVGLGTDVQKSDITKSVNNFFKDHGTNDWKDKVIGFGQKGGEISSWVTALVTATFAVTGVVKSVADVLSIVSPGVGLISWVFGIIGSVKSSKDNIKLMKDIQKDFLLLNSKMDQQYNVLKEYVDDSIIASDHERLVGELSQMQLHLSDCLLIKSKERKERCLEDRCSYVKAGFNKFAPFADRLNVVPGSAKEPIFQNLYIKIKFKDIKDKLLNSQEIKRVFANLPMFNRYVTSVLLQCETYRVIRRLKQNDDQNENIENEDNFRGLDSNGNEWKVDEKVNTYLLNSLWAIYEAYKSPAILIESGYVKDYERKGVKKIFAKKHYRKVQCRFQMNSHFKEYCDMEYTTNKLKLTEKEAEEECNRKMKFAKETYNRYLWESEGLFRKYIKIKEMREFLKKLNPPINYLSFVRSGGDSRDMATMDDREQVYNVTAPTNENEMKFSQKAEI